MMPRSIKSALWYFGAIFIVVVIVKQPYESAAKADGAWGAAWFVIDGFMTFFGALAGFS